MRNAQPRSRSTDCRIYGLVEAIVNAVTDDPEQEGRVRLTYPWFDGGREVKRLVPGQPAVRGQRIRLVLRPGRGRRGTGGVHSRRHALPGRLGRPVQRAGQATHRTHHARDQKMIRTKAGHQLTLDDSPQAQAVRIVTTGGHELVLDDQSGRIVVSGNGVSMTLNDDGSITVQASTVNVQASQVQPGTGASLSAVLGEELLTTFNTHVHSVPLPVPIPTTPPIIPATPAILSQVVKLI